MKWGSYVAALGLSCAVFLHPGAARAQAYPSKPIQLIVPASAGTTGDQIARLLGPRLTQRWNVPVVVENKVGAGGSIAFDFVAKAAADGHTLLFATTAFSTLPALRTNIPYDPVKSFVPVVSLGSSPMVLAVPAAVPVKSMHDWLDYAKKQPPGQLSYASPGIGSLHHLTMELFKQETGLELVHVPYKAMASAVNDLAAGHVQVAFLVLQTATALAEGGKLRLLALGAPRRNARFPQVPTFAEAGTRNIDVTSWVAVLAPAGTPAAVVTALNTELNRLLALPEIREALEQMGVEPGGGGAEAAGTLVRRDLQMWARVVKKAGIKPE